MRSWWLMVRGMAVAAVGAMARFLNPDVNGVTVSADAGLWATKQSEDQFFGYEHVMKVG